MISGSQASKQGNIEKGQEVKPKQHIKWQPQCLWTIRITISALKLTSTSRKIITMYISSLKGEQNVSPVILARLPDGVVR